MFRRKKAAEPSDDSRVDLVPMLTKIFRMMDASGDGHIDEQEGWAIGRALGGSGADAKLWWDTIIDADTDGSGTVDLKEWLAYNQKAYRGNELTGLGELQMMHDRLEQSLSRLSQQRQKALAAAAAAEVDVDDLEEIPMSTSEIPVNSGKLPSGGGVPAPDASSASRADALRARFQELDLDGDGSLTYDELGELLLSDGQLQALFNKADGDKSGTISFEEFSTAIDAFDKAEAEGEANMEDLLP
jgi:Ca2+-binding EF-hand superfamily protein